MKKNIIKQVLILVAIPMACFCSKEGPSASETAKVETVEISAVVPDTKVAFAQGLGELTLTWQDGDALKVCGNTSSTFTLSEGAGESKGVFSGSSVDGSSFDVFYPATYTDVEALKGRSYTGQVQDGNGSLAHLEFNALAEDLPDYTSINFGAAGAKLNGVLKMVLKLPDSVTEVSSLSLATENSIFYTTNGTESKSNTIGMSFTEGTTVTDHVLTAYMMTSWQPVTIASTDKLTLTVTVPGKACSYEKTFRNTDNIQLNGGSCLTIDISDATVLNHKIAGSGTSTNPYQLWDAEDMLLIRSNYLIPLTKVHFKMMADIDFASVSNWLPLNDGNAKNADGTVQNANEIDFDGNNHVISNLKSTGRAYASFFGVLVGECRNVTFRNCTVLQETGGSACAIVAGYAGQGSSRPATIKNVSIEGCSATYNNTGSAACAGICAGVSNYCTLDGIVIDSASSVSLTTNNNSAIQQHVGGVLGMADKAACIIKNCSCAGSVTNNVNLTTENTSIGGIAGNIARGSGCEVENCSFSGTLNAAKCRYAGGIVGLSYDQASTITKCSNYANINCGSTWYIGGIVGRFMKGSVSQCFNKGNITGYNFVGGICGILGAGASGAKNTIEYCYSTGNITAGMQVGGGVVGDVLAYSDVKYCFSAGAVYGPRGMGGVIGRVCNGDWTATGIYNNEIVSCHAYNTSITATQTTTGAGSGTIIGYAATKNTYTDCYRHPAFGSDDPAQTRLSCANEPSELPVDQGLSITPSSPVTVGIVGTSSAKGPLTMIYTYPFHGNVADASYNTMTLLAKALSWDQTIWVLADGSDHPTLKDNPEE